MGNRTIIGLIIITLGIFFYSLFIKDPVTTSGEDLITRENKRVSAESLGREIIQTLEKVKKITLDTSIFALPGYRRLNNLNQEIRPQDPGKDSPFDPIDRSFFLRLNNVNPVQVQTAIETGEVGSNAEEQEESEPETGGSGA